VVILQNGSTISRTNTSTKNLEDYVNPILGPNGSLTQQIKGIIPSLIYGDRREQENNFAQIIAQESKRPFLYFKRY
jgi:hypothetical protein